LSHRRHRGSTGLAVAAISGALSAGLTPVIAQEHSVEQLQRLVERQDAMIGELLRRIEQLERRLDGAEDQPRFHQLPLPLAPAVSDGEPGAASLPLASEGRVVASPAEPTPYEVNEEALDRALERALVRAGALLVPPGEIEVEPSFAFTRRELSTPLVLTDDGAPVAVEQAVRRNEFDVGLVLRLGLPLKAQLELGLPYRVVEESRVTSAALTPRQEVRTTGLGFGDLSIVVAKALLEEGAWRPDLIARLRWDTATGKKDDGGVALAGGFHELSGSLTLAKSQDPLVFFGTFSYGTTFARDGLDPGDELGLALGAVLAVSPESSLRLVLDQRFVDDLRLDGRAIEGSDRVVSTLVLGASSVLGRGVLLDVAAGVGLTRDAPDYSLSVALPIRFGVPR
jgi:hypothetical protein